MKQIDTLLIDLLMDLLANAENSGTCGPNLRWLLTDNGVLVITGKGKMNDYSHDNTIAPWSKSDIKRIIIGDGVTTIEEFAFFNCSKLTSVTIPNSVTKIGGNAFGFCSALTSVNIPNSVTTIGRSAFYDCSALTSVTIPNSVTEIGDYAFYNCSELTSVTIPNSVTRIGDWAFSGCRSLKNFTFGSGLRSIGQGAFSDCINITQISSEAVVPPICDSGAFYGINKYKCKLIVPKNRLHSYTWAYQWGDFLLIEGSTTLGITNTAYNNSGLADVYTIDGTKRLSKASADEINALPKGMYIVNGKKIIII
ncbi:leucine-rich repeat domain-containing protein [Prevotella pallens]|uniref:leucine-rich repeat domain-containing protein n=1 Tax=Prevotella pallens TaxID=60133 RepID=UPI0028D5F4E3|nr:leucine-rich repeat domain-containing protein [Prevotella pallens]